MVCENAPTCIREMIGHDRDALVEDLTLEGWVFKGLDGDENPTYECSTCQRSPAPPPVTHAPPLPVQKGAPVFDDNGDVIGHYASDGDADEEVVVDLVPTLRPIPPATDDGPDDHPYADMLAGSDPDDDSIGRQSAVAPAVDEVIDASGTGSGRLVPQEGDVRIETGLPGDARVATITDLAEEHDHEDPFAGFHQDDNVKH